MRARATNGRHRRDAQVWRPQLQNQQGSVEGVSIDEESSNLMLYERSYQAAAKVISTIDTLMGNVLDMGVTDPGY